MYVLDWRQGHEGDGGVNSPEWRVASWGCAQMHMLQSDLPRWAALLYFMWTLLFSVVCYAAGRQWGQTPCQRQPVTQYPYSKVICCAATLYFVWTVFAMLQVGCGLKLHATHSHQPDTQPSAATTAAAAAAAATWRRRRCRSQKQGRQRRRGRYRGPRVYQLVGQQQPAPTRGPGLSAEPTAGGWRGDKQQPADAAAGTKGVGWVQSPVSWLCWWT